MRAAGRGAFSQLGDSFASARGTSFHATSVSFADFRTEFRSRKISQAASESSEACGREPGSHKKICQ